MNTDYPIVQRPTAIDVDLGHLTHNLECIRRHTAGAGVMPIIKANAYGHGLVPIARHLEACGVDQLGVAFLEEGIALRQAGVRLPILVLGGILKTQIEFFLRYDLEITVSSLDKLRQAEAAAMSCGKEAVVHLKIDTGMERVGVHSETAGPFIEAAVQSRWCRVKGIYSHLACADDPACPLTGEQLERFHAAVAHFPRVGAPMPIRHLANSGGILYFPETHLDMVRPGILLYGVYPGPDCPRILDVLPLMRLSSQVVYFKVVQPGRTVSYGATWRAEELCRVVTVPIGYGDGYRRSLSNRAEVLIGGRRHPIIGRVCMDQFMVNIGWNTAYNGDEVVLIGRQGDERISVEEMAERADTIPYEILTCLNDRIPRIYHGGEEL